MATKQDKSQSEASYWSNQITSAEKDPRHRRWLDVGQRFYDRYLLEADGLTMHGTTSGVNRPKELNLFWTNVQTQLPMLYSRLPEPYIQRRFGNRDPVARMAATIAERATKVDLERDDFDAQAESLAEDYLVVGRGVLRGVYESTIVNSRIVVKEENLEDGEPRFITEHGQTIPGDLVEKDRRGLFLLDPQVRDERAPLCHWFWKDLLIGPGRSWKDIQSNGWIAWICYMSKADVEKRFKESFGEDVAEQLTFAYSPFDLAKDEKERKNRRAETSSTANLAKIYEIWDARSRQIFWLSEGGGKPGAAVLLDKQQDPLDLEGFFNTPRPLLTTHGPESMIPTPDYAQYRTQAAELDEMTSKIEVLIEEIKGGGVYDLTTSELGNALRKKEGGWTGVQNWQGFTNAGGLQGAVQQFDNRPLVETVVSLYQHQENVKRTADEIAGMPDIFRGQQAEKDERLGQTAKRANMGGLRVNDKQRDFQRYLSDALAIKTEIIVSQFDERRILEMADAQALIAESPEVARLDLMAESEEGQQAMQAAQMGDPQAAQTVMQFTQARQAAVQKQMQLIQNALAMLKSDRMRTFKLSIETDSTVSVDEAQEKAEASEFVTTISTMMQKVLFSDALAQSPELKPLAAQMLMFVVRKFKVGRSLEQQFEETINKLVTAPPPEQQPDPLTLDVQRQAQKDQMDADDDEQKNQIELFKANIDAFEAATKRQEAHAKAMEAAKDGTREDLALVDKILNTESVGNA